MFRRALTHSTPQLRASLKAAPGRVRNYLPPPTIYPLRASSWSAKVLYRKDGTPRSKRKGIAIALTVTLTLLFTYGALDLVVELEDESRLLRALVHFQDTKIHHGSLDMSQYENALRYFLQFCAILNPDGKLLKIIADAAKRLEGQTKEEMHATLRSLLEKINQILSKDWKGEGKEDSCIEAAQAILACLVEGLTVFEQTFGDDGEFVKLVEQVGDLKGSKYEVLG